MRLFQQTPEDYYNAPYAEFPALIRGTVVVVMAILWAFSKLMWRWKVEDADLLFERQEGPGSVVICTKRAEEQAEEYGHGMRRELFYLTVHGVMHCLGYDHETEADKAQMRAKEEEVLRKMGLERE